VRVFRGKVGEAGERLYIYEGLYRVAAHKRERSKDGPQVTSKAVPNTVSGWDSCAGVAVCIWVGRLVEGAGMPRWVTFNNY
jgi:hypothetical protein